MRPKRRVLPRGSVLLCIVGFLRCDAGIAAGEDPAPLPAPLERMIEQSKNIRSLSADITETRQLRTLSRPLVSKGHLWFVAPSSFRWERGSPGETVLIGNAAGMFLIREGKQGAVSCSRIGDGTTSAAGPLAISGLLPGNHDALLRRFRVKSVAVRSGVCHAEMTPPADAPLHGISSLHLDFHVEDGRWIRLRIITGDGSSLLQEFSNVRTNPVISEHLFETKRMTVGKSLP